MSPERHEEMDAARAAFGRLSPAERKVVGEVEDYAWDEATVLPARVRPESTQFSIRVDRELFEGLQEAAQREGATFSEVVRYALRHYIWRGSVGVGTWNYFVTTGVTRGPFSLTVRGSAAEQPSSRRTVSPGESFLPVVQPGAESRSDDVVTEVRV